MAQYELNLRDYWQIIRKRRQVLIMIFLSVSIFSVIYANTQSPIYRASASVRWIERRPLGSLLTELVQVDKGDPLATQKMLITSLPVMEKVVMDLGLAGEPNASAADVMSQAEELQGAVSVEVIGDTNILQIMVTYPKPKMAADIANKVAEFYIAENLKEKTKESRSVREFIERQLIEVSVKLRTSEDELARFNEIEAPSGIAVPLQNRLAELDSRRQGLLQLYTPLHPDVKALDEQIEETKERLKKLPQKELEFSRLSREVEIDSKLYLDLKGKLEGARIAEAEKTEDVSLVNRAVPPGSPISPNKPLNYLFGVIIGLMLGLAGAFMTEQVDASIGTIEDVENFIKLPALGIIPFLRVKGEKQGNFMDNFIRKIWPKKLEGDEEQEHMRKQLLIYYSSTSPVSEAYKMLRTKIQVEVFKEKIQGKILMITSSGPSEGKSITSANLAIVMAQAGLHTLLIDADMRRSSIHKIFGLKKRDPGLCDVLRGTVKAEEAIRTFTDILMGDLGFDDALKVPGLDSLSILTSGSLPTIPAELLSSDEMTELLKKMRNKFDLILLDTPPVLAVADAVILAPKTDGVIPVYRVGKTARFVLSRAKTQLTDAGAQVKGIILNNISPEIETRYAYPYQYKDYGKYYTEKKDGT